MTLSFIVNLHFPTKFSIFFRENFQIISDNFNCDYAILNTKQRTVFSENF